MLGRVCDPVLHPQWSADDSNAHWMAVPGIGQVRRGRGGVRGGCGTRGVRWLTANGGRVAAYHRWPGQPSGDRDPGQVAATGRGAPLTYGDRGGAWRGPAAADDGQAACVRDG